MNKIILAGFKKEARVTSLVSQSGKRNLKTITKTISGGRVRDFISRRPLTSAALAGGAAAFGLSQLPSDEQQTNPNKQHKI